ncbi:hypothetical protein ZHAS_00019884 [Anopheles sinensis]|uniref:Uncharacterized protein n=1 Tax=Anopheles sinensis TaxID=74873 RepID=A0A084WMG3_ANOSI|nr:hypothetical protein ZHAS_00019884 [Anopheles sinensis]
MVRKEKGQTTEKKDARTSETEVENGKADSMLAGCPPTGQDNVECLEKKGRTSTPTRNGCDPAHAGGVSKWVQRARQEHRCSYMHQSAAGCTIANEIHRNTRRRAAKNGPTSRNTMKP